MSDRGGLSHGARGEPETLLGAASHETAQPTPVEPIGIGWKVWAKSSEDGGRSTIDGYMVGGIVVDITQTVDEHGEIHRAYRTMLHVGHQAPRESVIPEWQIGEVEKPYGPDRAKMLRRIAQEIAKPLLQNKRDLSLTATDNRLAATFIRLFSSSAHTPRR